MSFPAHVGRLARGFTLVEMLVGLVVFGLLGLAATGVLAWAADNRGSVATHSTRLAQLQRARALMQADLGQVALRRVRGPDGRQSPDAFIGATHRGGASHSGPGPLLGFVRRGWSNPEGAARASLQYVEYRLVDGRLERATRPMLDGATAGEARVLLDGIVHAEVGYHHHGAWDHGWPGGAAELPAAVRLDLELEGFGRLEQRFLVTGASR